MSRRISANAAAGAALLDAITRQSLDLCYQPESTRPNGKSWLTGLNRQSRVPESDINDCSVSQGPQHDIPSVIPLLSVNDRDYRGWGRRSRGKSIFQLLLLSA